VVKKVVLHGDGSPTRRYLFASDAADAFDTIFHKGDVGQIYNIGSRDEISNKEMCGILFKTFGIPEDRWPNWIEHVQNRPFNDMRYAVDGQKLMQLF
jgi:dTDP-D-glucose 4,6-dehydratase